MNLNTMYRRAGLVVLLFLIAAVMTAQTVTQKKAQDHAVTFMRQMGWNTHAVTRKMMAGNSSSTYAPYYIFNGGNHQGFVIVSGDERTITIL